MNIYDDPRLMALLQSGALSIGPQDMGQQPSMGVPGALRMGGPPPALDSRTMPPPQPGPAGPPPAQPPPPWLPGMPGPSPWLPGMPGPSPVAQAQQDWAQKMRQQYQAPQKQGWGSMLGSALLPALVGRLAGGSGRDALLYGIGSAAQNFTTQLNQYRDVEAQIAAAEANLPSLEAAYGKDMAAAYKSMLGGGDKGFLAPVLGADGFLYAPSKDTGQLRNTGVRGYPTKNSRATREVKTKDARGNPITIFVDAEEAAARGIEFPAQTEYKLADTVDASGVPILKPYDPMRPPEAFVKPRTPTEVQSYLEAEEQLRAIPIALNNRLEAANAVNNAITQADQLTGFWSTGLFSESLASIGGTEARRLRNAVDTIKANIGFERLQQMREESETGGALGQVAVQELIALQSVITSLDQAGSAEDLKRALKLVKEKYARALPAYQAAMREKEQMFRRRMQEFGPRTAPGAAPAGAPAMPPAPAPGNVPPMLKRPDDYLNEAGF